MQNLEKEKISSPLITKNQKTTLPSVNFIRKWYLIDLKGKNIGRIAVKVAQLLRGKEKNIFYPNLDLGNSVVLLNAQSLLFSGDKLKKNFYYNHSGYSGGMRKRSLEIMIAKHPRELVQRIIKGMLPHNRLSRKQIKRLFIYSGSDHPHSAQAKYFTKIEF